MCGGREGLGKQHIWGADPLTRLLPGRGSARAKQNRCLSPLPCPACLPKPALPYFLPYPFCLIQPAFPNLPHITSCPTHSALPILHYPSCLTHPALPILPSHTCLIRPAFPYLPYPISYPTHPALPSLPFRPTFLCISLVRRQDRQVRKVDKLKPKQMVSLPCWALLEDALPLLSFSSD